MANYETHILARLSDFFTPSSPWPRRLWNWGTIPSLRELHGSPEWVEAKVLSQGSLTWLARDLEKVCGADPALGPPELRRQLQQVLRSRLQCGSNDQRRLGQLIEIADDGYLSRWRDLCTTASPPSAERAARAIASHLLAKGFSEDALSGWVANLSDSAPDVGGLYDSAIEQMNRTAGTYEVVVPFIAVPDQDNREASGDWLDAGELRAWMRASGFPNPRQNGGFKYQVPALDPRAAAAHVTGIVERMVARAAYTRSGGPPRPLGQVWISGVAEPLPLEPPPRGAYVHSIQRERHLYRVATDTPLDIALELAAPLNGSAPGPAISGAWAAVEMLLLNAKDDSQDGRGTIAADRLARLVTASWPRAELTALSYRHQPTSGGDLLTARLEASQTNRERALVIATAVSAGNSLSLRDLSDVAAQSRMTRLTSEPRRQILDVFELMRAAIRRFYRHRNILLHGGGVRVDSMESTLRTAAPLIGAGLDRIAHAYLTQGISAIDLSAKAEVRLGLVGDIHGLVTILE